MDNEAIIKVYASLIRKGFKRIEDVPENIRQVVKDELEQNQ